MRAEFPKGPDYMPPGQRYAESISKCDDEDSSITFEPVNSLDQR